MHQPVLLFLYESICIRVYSCSYLHGSVTVCLIGDTPVFLIVFLVFRGSLWRTRVALGYPLSVSRVIHTVSHVVLFLSVCFDSANNPLFQPLSSLPFRLTSVGAVAPTFYYPRTSSTSSSDGRRRSDPTQAHGSVGLSALSARLPRNHSFSSAPRPPTLFIRVFIFNGDHRTEERGLRHQTFRTGSR